MTRVLGPYSLDGEIGRGSSAIVYRATHTASGRVFALKLPRDRSVESLTRLRREARVLTLLDHPHVVRLVDFVAPGSDDVQDPSPAYLVMELLDGETLAARLSRVHALLVTDVAALLLPVVSAVGKAHSLGVLHRDLKLENVVVTVEGTVKVLDLGVAKLGASAGPGMATSPLTRSGSAIGTPYAMAPEQAAGEEVDHRADIWSVGIIAYCCLAGRRPVDGATVAQTMRVLLAGAIAPLSAIAPHVPKEVSELVMRSLKRDPAERPASLRQYREVLGRYAGVVTPDFDPPVALKRDSFF